MFSATAITAALAILAISVNVIDTEQVAPPGAVADADHTVATDGSGDFSTIQGAVDAAAAGDTIRILPGTYEESVLVDRDLTAVPPETIRDAKVLMTIVGGRVVYSR